MCNDPLLRSFRNIGFNVVRLPSASFAPFLLLESEGHRRVRVVGELGADLTAASAPLPAIESDVTVANVAVTTSSRVKGSVVVRFLDPFLGLLGILPSASASLAQEKDVSITITDVKRDAIRPGQLAGYLEDNLSAQSNHIRRIAAQKELFVTTAVLKSNSFSITLGRETASQLSAGASAAPVQVQVAADRGSAGRQVISFSGGQSLVFAFQAARLQYEDGEYLDYASASGLIGYQRPAESSGFSPGDLRLDDDALEPFTE
ncbi:MAG TPA: hypothetical protein VMF87_20070 [Streptosporangiaceae bacterium]|nr:hypothetical protein [Streptosporangiaceae bacterium]